MRNWLLSKNQEHEQRCPFCNQQMNYVELREKMQTRGTNKRGSQEEEYNFYPSASSPTKTDIRKLADGSTLTNNTNQITPIWERSTIDPDSQLKNPNNSEEINLINHDQSFKSRSKLTLGSLQYNTT